MTVSYTLKVANARFCSFSMLLFRWKGSIYKLLYKEFIVFISLFALFSVTYRRLLTEEQKHVFEKVAHYCNKYTDLIPMPFVLGFYVTLIVNRWWNQYTSIPLPDQLMCVVSSNVHGVDERGRILRRTLIRYANLSSVLILRSISTRVLKRFPTMDHIVDSGFMTPEELTKFESLHSDFNKYWIPCVWFTNLVAQVRREGRIRDDIAQRLLMDELNKYRAKCSMLFHYDWISIPLVYTQVVTIAVYSFFAFCLIGRQFVAPVDGFTGREVDFFIPIFTLLQFFFYAGWLKVAEQIINPFGEDDDDFETNKLIDRNLQVSLLSVDDMYQNLPPTEKDKYWNELSAQPPYTVATAAETLKPSFLGSTFDMRISEDPFLNEQVNTAPNTPRLRTPLLSRLFTVAPSPAVSLKNFGRNTRGTPLLRFRGDSSVSASSSPQHAENRDFVARIEETDEENEEKKEAGEGQTALLQVSQQLGPPETRKKKDGPETTSPVIHVKESSTESLKIDNSTC
ncbi:bestrophin-4 [Latimeria chalumnae]|uniref:Bestrophin homolog n=1 Tax=Latimeria chalumnae TaxID=7897 RepID=H3AAN6_LATCH|nr:PREDICTED: bestrophin-4 [Latimeria chalumnae]|eukprot:XP_006006297.1 PREDICTED: bestrophin-4 [Latimeria chalumnae]